MALRMSFYVGHDAISNNLVLSLIGTALVLLCPLTIYFIFLSFQISRQSRRTYLVTYLSAFNCRLNKLLGLGNVKAFVILKFKACCRNRLGYIHEVF